MSDVNDISNAQKNGVDSETALWILSRQRRCVECGGTYNLHIHHRIFKGEGEAEVRRVIELFGNLYKKNYGSDLGYWGLNDLQNLVVLCQNHHEGKLIGIHGGNNRLRNKFKYSFTCPVTGFNMPFIKNLI